MTEIKDDHIVVSVEEIGSRVGGGSNQVTLHSDFVGRLLTEYGVDEKKTRYKCPVCHKGVLRKTKVTPNYSFAKRMGRETKRHVGDSIECDCTNPECNATFVGYCTFTWID